MKAISDRLVWIEAALRFPDNAQLREIAWTTVQEIKAIGEALAELMPNAERVATVTKPADERLSPERIIEL